MATVRGFGVVTSAAAPVLLIGGWTLAARLQYGFDSISCTISDLAARYAQDRWVMTAALAGTGLCHLGTALALRGTPARARLTLALGGLATLGVAAFPLPDSSAHSVAAGVAFVSLALWTGRLVPSVILAAGVAWFFVELLLGGEYVGVAERVAAGAQALWPLAVVLHARSIGQVRGGGGGGSLEP